MLLVKVRKNNMTYLGIDPGLKGGMAFIKEDGSVDLYPTPIIGTKDYDVPEINRILQSYTNIVAVLEKQHAMPGQGLTSTLKTGLGFGMFQACLSANGIKYDIIPAVRWQKNLFVGLPSKQDTKVSSAVIASRLFPEVSFRRSDSAKKPHDGLTDAACIAEYCKRLHSKSVPVTSTLPHAPGVPGSPICMKCGAYIPTAEDGCI
jgi:hypothetical protein